ncbi:cell division protein ZapD [Legionella londiniensis]|uniref:Cell division protein ZapD n=1 Tax=Legionella londiniensis TaxID=45068 RepID=A0A0W0VTI7_9GAMM|nr:cell division protein ZapD [Legionella londiniensis]KTD22982.1 Cell division protein ZapD [Legionella londiniensis]STX92909.1 Protein of uncharacterised function (DUF1342) [Legionella londiniensis]
MHQDTITFQLATHFLPKAALRLENLLQTIEQACDEKHPVVHHYALKSVLEIIKLIEKPELKSRFLKELMRIEHILNKSETEIPNALYANLFVQIQFLNHVAGRFGESVQYDPFLQSIRISLAGDNNDCAMHSPQLLLWLENEPELRQKDLKYWLKELKSLQDTVNLYLALLRSTASFDKIDMINGFYQCSLPAKSSCHLIMLRMDKKCGMVPKMQLGHHGLSLRLCEASSMNELRHTKTAMDLGICQI